MKRKSISKATRQLVLEKYDSHCAYCGKVITLKTLRVDHFLPLHKDGADDFSNYMPSCHSCNHYKSVFTLEQFRQNLSSVHERLVKPFLPRLCLDYGIIEITPFDGQFYFEKYESEQRQEV